MESIGIEGWIVLGILGLMQIFYFVVGIYLGIRAKKTAQKGVYFLSLQMISLCLAQIGIFLEIASGILYLGNTMVLIPMICALIFIHMVFYSEKKSPIKIIIPIFLFFGVILFIIFSLQFFNRILAISAYNVYGKITLIILTVLSYSFETYAPLKEWTKIKTLKIENHVKIRYLLFGISQLIYTITVIIYWFIDPLLIGTDPVVFTIVLFTLTIMGLYVLGTYLTWFMPDWFKNYLNGPDQEIEEDLPGEEIMED